MSKFDQWLKTLTSQEKRNLICNHYEDCKDCPLQYFDDCADFEKEEIIDYFKDSKESSERTNVTLEINALRGTMKLLRYIDYDKDEKACALHDTVFLAYRKEKKNED